MSPGDTSPLQEEGTSGKRRCSGWIISGLALLGLGLVCCGAYYGYTVTCIPDEPVWKDGQNFLHSPRSDARIGALFGAAVAMVLASAISVVGVVKGPRTRGCLVAGLFGPLAMTIALLAQFARNFPMP